MVSFIASLQRKTPSHGIHFIRNAKKSKDPAAQVLAFFKLVPKQRKNKSQVKKYQLPSSSNKRKVPRFLSFLTWPFLLC
jgi:hypothetical protein